MTIQEATKSALDECRNNDFFKKVDMHKLIRELYPQPFPTIIGISFTQVNRKCSKVYDDIMEKYKEIPEDKRPDKTTYFAFAMKSMREEGYEELVKVIGIMYVQLN